ncbi:MAG: M20/M25/M40 family metallo-hydrolase [Kiritimatiellae bacterium]|nr:M20/M25/M40 family metallo-hydrolase [Kiritimatiellia bacterium]
MQTTTVPREIRCRFGEWKAASLKPGRKLPLRKGKLFCVAAVLSLTVAGAGVDTRRETTVDAMMSERQKALLGMVEKHANNVLDAERWLWAHPQTGFTEWQAHEYLTNRFAALGYSLTCAGNIPGFYADLDTGRPGPKVCFIGELDALDIPGHPEAVNGIAHLCGHHAQCAALIGVAAALKEPGALDGMSGSIRLMLVPSEELVQVSFRDKLREEGTIRYFGGKPEFMHRGFFDGVGLVMNVHQGGPARADGVVFDAIISCNGCLTKRCVFKGRTAHAAACPHDGVNAQYAATLALQACNALRETFRDRENVRWHPVLRGADCAVNNIPDRLVLESYVRGNSMEAIKRENRKINRAIAGAALAMGARVEIHDRPGYAPGHFDRNLMRVAEQACAEMVGPRKVSFNYTGHGSGSTDMSDLACVMPCAWFNVNGGFTGCGHRVDYRVVDPYRLCVDSAKAQLLVIDALLKNSAAAAKGVIAKFKPLYPSIKAYLKAADEFFLDCEAVQYDKDGNATVTLQ